MRKLFWVVMYAYTIHELIFFNGDSMGDLFYLVAASAVFSCGIVGKNNGRNGVENESL